MNKKLSLFLLLFMLPITAQNSPIQEVNTIQTTLDHINTTKTALALSLKKNVHLGSKALSHMKNKLQNKYESCLNRVNNVIRCIAQSDEFITTIDQVTDFMATEIVINLKDHDSIIINADDYPLKDKVDYEVEQASLASDNDTLQMFNILYITGVNLYGSEILLKKLDLIGNKLNEEITSLTVSNQPTHQ